MDSDSDANGPTENRQASSTGSSRRAHARVGRKPFNWKRHGSAVIAASAAVVGSLAGALIAGNYAANAVHVQIQAQAAADRATKAGDVYGRFLFAVDQFRAVRDIGSGLPPYGQADENLQRADIDLFLYGSDEILAAGHELEDAVGWSTNATTPLDEAAYRTARNHFIDVFKKDLHR